MSRQAWLSIVGLYNYDNTLFDDMYIPNGVDKELLVNNILIECAELEILLPDAGIMKKAINFWSQAQAAVWDKLYETTILEYNPLWNKDAHYTETESHDVTATRDLKSTDDGTDTDKRSAYNATAFQNQQQTTIDHDYTDTGTVRDAGSSSRERYEYGNIGVTSSMQLINEQRDVVKFSIYDYIVRSFKERFCLLVY